MNWKGLEVSANFPAEIVCEEAGMGFFEVPFPDLHPIWESFLQFVHQALVHTDGQDDAVHSRHNRAFGGGEDTGHDAQNQNGGAAQCGQGLIQ